MSKESFSWKSLFINDDNDSSEKKDQPQKIEPSIEVSKFPSKPDASITPQSSANLNNPFINEIIDVYQKGFDSLNLDDFDFFELYKSVVAVGPTNPQSYQMAFAMGCSIKPDLTKAFLLEKSKFYISEIEKVYANYDAKGRARKNDLEMSITRDKVNLTKSISDLESQIASLQRELDQKKSELNNIDAINSGQHTELEMKIEANNFAKQKIVDSINLVVSGINQYL